MLQKRCADRCGQVDCNIPSNAAQSGSRPRDYARASQDRRHRLVSMAAFLMLAAAAGWRTRRGLETARTVTADATAAKQRELLLR
jgi:hypothetical protein